MNFEIKAETKKTKVGYTIRQDILKKFNALTKKRGYKKSFIVEQLLEGFLTNESKKESLL